jgi:8-hydroxy-5-deazaflavin:NADPH oxidoreductase
MKIGIIGSGNIGGTIGTIWANQGHEICFGTRDRHSDKIQTLLSNISGKAKADTLENAAKFGDVILIAIHWYVLPEILPTISHLLADKIVIDATNRMFPPPPESADTAAEEIARLCPGSKVVKAFNSLGANNLKNLDFNGQKPSTFIAGDDPEAKKVVTELAEQIGFDVVDVGVLADVHYIESLAKLWVHLAKKGGRNTAFKLLKK